MSTELTTAGYEDLRDYIETNWTYIELYDDTDSQIARYEIGGTNASWIHSDGDQTLVAELVVDGTMIAHGTTVVGSRIFNVSSSGSILSEDPFDHTFTVYRDGDQLTVNHEIEVPQV